METVDVVIGTYGNVGVWGALAERAECSAYLQTVPANEVVWIHGETLAEARNQGAQLSEADYLIFLDADDELDPLYIQSMLNCPGDIRWPSTLGVVNGQEDDYPVLLQPQRSFMVGNHMVIGSMVRREQFLAVGGFRELPVLEDWDCWIRMRLAGATIAPCPEAIYRVHVQPQSRNQHPAIHGQTYMEIQRRYQDEWHFKFGNAA